MDQGKILILNLSKGRIGEDASHLLGALLISKIQLAAMSRVDIPEEERQDFYLYVDEFQNFATESFVNILSEARKYHLDLILAHQYITQMEETVRDAVFGNIGTLICFRVGAEDAEFLEKEFIPYFSARDLVNLTKYNIYIKLMIDGVSSHPFSALTLPPFPKLKENYREKIISQSRERYGTSRRIVEEKIAEWTQIITEEQKITNGKSVYEANCWKCGKKTWVPFKPDGLRPIYCKKCLKDRESEDSPPEKTEDSPPEKKSSLEISLEEAFKKYPPREKKKRIRKEVNIGDLRETLKETLGGDKKKRKPVKKGTLKPGQKVKF